VIAMRGIGEHSRRRQQFPTTGAFTGPLGRVTARFRYRASLRDPLLASEPVKASQRFHINRKGTSHGRVSVCSMCAELVK